MLRVASAELLKLRKRPAVWVCFALLLVLLLAFGYGLTWFIYTYSKPPASIARQVSYAALKVSLYPAHFHQNTMSGGAQLGGVIAMIIGVLMQGSEYGWATVKTVFTQRARRWEIIAVRLLVITGLMLLMAAAALALGAAASWVLATIDGKSTAFPGAETIVKSLLALWLVFDFWAVFGFALATLFQQSALAIGLGLAYALVIEALVFGLADQFAGDTSKQIHQWFPLENATFLVQSFGRATPEIAGQVAAKPFAGGAHGAIMLVVYCAAFAALSLRLTQRRDVA